MFTTEEQANETVDFNVTWSSGRRRLSMGDLNGHLLLCSGSIIIPPGCEHKHIMPTGITRTCGGSITSVTLYMPKLLQELLRRFLQRVFCVMKIFLRVLPVGVFVRLEV